MFAGHFGVAAAVKAKSPETPLWALILGTQLLDIVFVPLYLTGVETIVPVESGGYGEAVIHADYSHSLVGALSLALIAGMLSARFWGKRSGLIMASVVFSHWLLDLLVHRSDLPLLPGNFGGLPLLGLGVWKYASVSIVIESLLIAIGFAMYFRSLLTENKRSSKGWALTAGGVMGVLLVLSLVTDVLGIG